MKIRSLLFATLTAIPIAGCCTSSVCGCDPDEEQFDIDEALSRDQVDTIVSNWGHASAQDVECEQACQTVYRDTRGWEAADIDSCSMTLPTQVEGDTGDTGDSFEDGSVQCAGRGIEYWCEGRRPLGHVEHSSQAGDALGRACASMAYLEAAAVDAFVELAQQLRELEAPQELVDRCLRAAQDERHHTLWLTAFAERHGAVVPKPVAHTPSSPELLDIALHNAVEGCVHETWAALAAHVKAQRAGDPLLRRIFARIAEDETEHAQLAWDLHRWFLAQLDLDGRRQLVEAQRQALRQLPDLAGSLSELPGDLGQPEGEQAQALAADLARRLAV